MTKVKDKVQKTVKTVFIITGILFAIFGFIIGYSVVKDLEQEELLKQEIINYSNKNIATYNFEIKLKIRTIAISVIQKPVPLYSFCKKSPPKFFRI